MIDPSMMMPGMSPMMPPPAGAIPSMPGMDGMMAMAPPGMAGMMPSMVPGGMPGFPAAPPAPGIPPPPAMIAAAGTDGTGMNPMMQMPGMQAPGGAGMPMMNPMMMAQGGMQNPGMMMGGQGGMMMMQTPNGMMMVPNGMMMGGQGGMMNPMMGMNPMMNPMMMGMNPMMMGGQTGQAEAPAEEAAEEDEETQAEASSGQPSLRERLGIGPRTRPARDLVWGKNETDPQVAELCKQFAIEDRIRDRLNDVMMTREGSFEQDMKALWEVCETAKKPSGYLMVKISELERGVFTGAQKSDNDLTTFAQKHKMDDRVLAKLIEVFAPRQESKRDELRQIEKAMRASDRPHSVVMPMLECIKRTGRLPSPERRKKKSRSRSRSNSRTRKKSKSRSRSKSRKRRKD